MAGSNTALLPDGREIGFARYGVNDGPKVFYLHGNPGSRLEGRMFEPAASNLGISIIAVDRPGIGLSSPQNNRTILDHSRDIKNLAEILGFDEYYILGMSGGGPYALGSTLTQPVPSLRGVAVVVSLGPHQFGLKGMAWPLRFLHFMFRYAPRLLKFLTGPIIKSKFKRSDEEMVQDSMKKLKDKERGVFSDPDVIRMFCESAREHFRQGLDGWMQDMHILAANWDFMIEDIEFSPIKLWFAEHDVNVASCTGPELKRILGDKAELHMENESHATLGFNCGEKILADLVKKG